MYITILGSGTNLHPSRAAAGYLLETDHAFLVDFGPGTLKNLTHTDIDRHSIDHLFFTHHHPDHLSDFIPFFFDAVIASKLRIQKIPRKYLHILGPVGTRKIFGSILRTFPSFHPPPFEVKIQNLNETVFYLGKTKITTRYMKHSSILRALGYRIEYEGKILVYSGDAEYSENLKELCHNADIAILDCSFPSNIPKMNHMNALECGRIAKEADVKTLILSHFYPICEKHNLIKESSSVFHGKILLATDRLRVKV